MLKDGFEFYKNDFDIWKRVFIYKKGEKLIDKKYFLKAEF